MDPHGSGRDDHRQKGYHNPKDPERHLFQRHCAGITELCNIVCTKQFSCQQQDNAEKSWSRVVIKGEPGQTFAAYKVISQMVEGMCLVCCTHTKNNLHRPQQKQMNVLPSSRSRNQSTLWSLAKTAQQSDGSVLITTCELMFPTSAWSPTIP